MEIISTNISSEYRPLSGKDFAFIIFNFLQFPFLMLDEQTKKGSLSFFFFFFFGIPLILVCYCYLILYY